MRLSLPRKGSDEAGEILLYGSLEPGRRKTGWKRRIVTADLPEEKR